MSHGLITVDLEYMIYNNNLDKQIAAIKAIIQDQQSSVLAAPMSLIGRKIQNDLPATMSAPTA